MTDASAPVDTTDNAATATIDAGAVAQTEQTTTQVQQSAAPDTAQQQSEAPKTETFEFADWLAKQPDEIKNSPSLTKFKTWEGIAKSYANLERMVGTDKVPIPKEGDKEGWDKFWKAAGRPDEPKGYGFAKPETIPEGVNYSEELDTTFAQKAHELGLNKAQANALRQWQLDMMSQGYTKQQDDFHRSRVESEAQLKVEFGRAFDQKLKAANLAVKQYGGDELAAYLEQTGLGDHPALVKAFAKIADKTMGESELVGDKTVREMTPADLQKAIADFRKDHHAALHDGGHVEHNLRVKEMQALYDKAFPS